MALMHVCACLCLSDIAGKGIKQAQGQGNCLKACQCVAKAWPETALQLLCHFLIF